MILATLDQTKYLELIKKLEDRYRIIEYGKYDFGNFYDKNRLFHILKKR